MTLNTTKTVRELALEVPDATRVFERLKIDYCCGGGRNIAEACEAVGVPVDELSRLLDEAGAARGETRDFNAGALSDLIRHILDAHHVYTREESARIQALLEKVCAKHGGNHPELHGVRALFLKLPRARRRLHELPRPLPRARSLRAGLTPTHPPRKQRPLPPRRRA